MVLKKVILAEGAGFCFGVRRAIELARNHPDGDFYTLGPLIHNDQAVRELEECGVRSVAGLRDLENCSGDVGVIIRSHGIGEFVYKEIARMGFKVIDATCPFVKKIHRIVREYCLKGYRIWVFGDARHPEVVGIIGWGGENVQVIRSAEEVEKCDEPICLVAQTTASVKEFKAVCEAVRNNCREAVIFNTICGATAERQEEARRIAEQVDAMIVVGGKESSNTRKLFDICKGICPETFWVESAEEVSVDAEGIHRAEIIGMTAGASTPEWVIEEIIDKIGGK